MLEVGLSRPKSSVQEISSSTINFSSETQSIILGDYLTGVRSLDTNYLRMQPRQELVTNSSPKNTCKRGGMIGKPDLGNKQTFCGWLGKLMKTERK